MTVNSKYNIGDYVWVIHNNRPLFTELLRPILNPYIAKTPKNKQDFTDLLEWEINATQCFSFNVRLSEKYIFDTKEEAINSLR